MIPEALEHKRWEELEALEHEGRTIFFDAIRRRGTGKTPGSSVRVGIRVLRKHELRAATLDAGAWAEKEGIDPVKATHKEAYEGLVQMSILARVIRDPEAPYVQHLVAEELERQYDAGSLEEIWAKYKYYQDALDPRDPIKDDKEFWLTCLAIGRTRSLLPLTEFEPLEQIGFILRTVELALTSPTCRSFCSQFESSTPAP